MKKNIIIAISSIILLVSSLSSIFMGSSIEKSALSAMEEFTPKEEVDFAKQYLSLIQSHNFDAVEIETDPKILTPQAKEQLIQLANLFPSEQPKNIKIIGANTQIFQDVSHIGLTFEYEFSNKWLLATVELQKTNNALFVESIHAEPLADSLENMNHFSFWGKSMIHYAIFCTALLLLLLNVYALALCIKTPMPKRKWLWIIFVLAGFCTLSFNWATGEFFFNPFMIHIPLVQFSQGLYQPFVIMMMVPLGSIIFLLKRKKWLA